ncbi:MAG: biopolymer transporter [Cyanobacteria bacterium J06639_1]
MASGIPTRNKGWGRSLLHGGIAALSVLAASCTQNPFRTPQASLSNAGLNSLYPDSDPSLSADGRYIAFSSFRQGSENVYLFDRDRNQLVELPGVNAEELAASDPDISADGRYIVYLSTSSGRSDVYLYDRQARTRPENISRSLAGDIRNPSISPDGRFISFENNDSGQWDIEIYDRGAALPSSDSRSDRERATPDP